MNNKSVLKIFAGIRVYMVLSVVTAIVLIPFVWMVTTSLKYPTKVLAFPPQWLPDPIKWSNFVEVFQVQPFHLYFFNSLYIAILVCVGTCFFSALAGYAFAKIEFPFKNTIFLILLSSMMIPTEVTAIPLFDWFSKLHLVNTHFPLIVPPMFGAYGMMGVFLFRQFFITVPNDLVEAAKIDGCSPWRTFVRIMFPLSRPALATLFIFVFVNSWNEFFEPLIYLNSSRLYTLPLALSLFTDQSGTQWNLVMAASVIATVPLLIVFFFAQKKFIEGVTMTGLK